MAGRREIEGAFLLHTLGNCKYTSEGRTVHYIARPVEAARRRDVADPVVINLRQVATVRMQIRLKFRSLTTDASVLTGDDKFFDLASDPSMRLSDVTRSPSLPPFLCEREHLRARMQKCSV